MTALLLLAILSLVFFPVGNFTAGVSLRGYSLTNDVPTWQKLMNLSFGVITVFVSLIYVDQARGYGKDAFNRFSELDISTLSISEPIAEYLGFFPWVVRSIGQEYTTLLRHFGLDDLTLMGLQITPGLFALICVGAIICFIALAVLLLEIRIHRQRKKHKRYQNRIMLYMKNYDDLASKYPGELTEDQEVKVVKAASKSTAHIKNPGPWRSMFAPITGPHQYPVKSHRDIEETFLDALVILDGIVTPIVAAAYTVIFFIPTMLIIGVWALVAASLIIAALPFAWLYANGMRFRMH